MEPDCKLEYYLNRCQELSAFSTDRVKKLLKIISSLSAEKFLDIGCGDGTLTLLLGQAVKAKEMYGVDMSLPATKQAINKGVKARQLNIESDNLPFEGDYFDLILCGEVVEHLFEPVNLLREIYRVLKRGGVLIITTPNLGSWYNRLSLLSGHQPFGTAASLECPRAGKPLFTAHQGKTGMGDWGGEHIRVITLAALKYLLKFCNFEILAVRGSYVSYKGSNFAYRLIRLIDRMTSLSPSLATWMVIKARKPS
ncbi:Ubiquinone biosynthesis O-methyltransferase [subsurface metagenome]